MDESDRRGIGGPLWEADDDLPPEHGPGSGGEDANESEVTRGHHKGSGSDAPSYGHYVLDEDDDYDPDLDDHGQVQETHIGPDDGMPAIPVPEQPFSSNETRLFDRTLLDRVLEEQRLADQAREPTPPVDQPDAEVPEPTPTRWAVPQKTRTVDHTSLVDYGANVLRGPVEPTSEPSPVPPIVTGEAGPPPALTPPSDSGWMRDHWRAAVAVAVCVVAVLAAVIGYFSERSDGSPSSHPQVHGTSHPQVNGTPALAASVIVWAGIDADSRSDIFSRDTATPGSSPQVILQGSPAATQPVISPDRKSIAYVAQDQARLGTPYLVGSDGTHNRPLFAAGTSPCDSVGRMAWSPDSTMLAVVCFGADLTRQGILIVRASDGSIVGHLKTASAQAGSPAWSSQGVIAYWDLPGGSLPAGAIFSIKTRVGPDGSLIQEPRVRLTTGASNSLPAWSPDGENLVFQHYTQTGHWNLLLSIAGAPARPLTLNPGNEDDPTWSPDGSSVVFVRSPLHSAASDLWSVDIHTHQQTPIVTRQGKDTMPSW